MKFKGTIVLLFFMMTKVLCAQLEEQDPVKRISFGLNVGMNFPSLIIEEVPNLSPIQKNNPGVRYGMFMDYKVSDHLHFSPKVEYSYNRSSVQIPFSTTSSNFSSYNIFPGSLELMTHAIINAGKGSLRPYILIGPNYRIPDKDRNAPSSVFSNRNDLAIDLGIGLEKVFKHFKIAPEIRYSRGLYNVNQNPTLKSVKYNNICVVFNFRV